MTFHGYHHLPQCSKCIGILKKSMSYSLTHTNNHMCIIICLGSTLQLRDFLKWLTGSYEIPPLGFPKRFSVTFVHGCQEGCACRPTVSTCDVTIKLPVHIRDETAMKEMIVSAIQDSYGFDLI